MKKADFDKFLAPKKETVKVVIYSVPKEHNLVLKRLARERGVTVQKILLALINKAVQDA